MLYLASNGSNEKCALGLIAFEGARHLAHQNLMASHFCNVTSNPKMYSLPNVSISPSLRLRFDIEMWNLNLKIVLEKHP